MHCSSRKGKRKTIHTSTPTGWGRNQKLSKNNKQHDINDDDDHGNDADNDSIKNNNKKNNRREKR